MVKILVIIIINFIASLDRYLKIKIAFGKSKVRHFLIQDKKTIIVVLEFATRSIYFNTINDLNPFIFLIKIIFLIKFNNYFYEKMNKFFLQLSRGF